MSQWLGLRVVDLTALSLFLSSLQVRVRSLGLGLRGVLFKGICFLLWCKALEGYE